MTVTPAEFKARYTEFASVADPRVQIFLDDAALEMSEATWGDLYDRGQGALAAHYLSIAEKNAAGGGGSTAPISSKKVGDVSITYAVTPSGTVGDSTASFMDTSYGQDYLGLLELVGQGAIAVVT